MRQCRFEDDTFFPHFDPLFEGVKLIRVTVTRNLQSKYFPQTKSTKRKGGKRKEDDWDGSDEEKEKKGGKADKEGKKEKKKELEYKVMRNLIFVNLMSPKKQS